MYPKARLDALHDGIFSVANTDEKGDFAGWVKVLDFAGGTVVHVNSGTAGLAACIMLGRRKDSAPPHNMVLTFIGAALLFPDQASDKELGTIENCLAQGVKG